jgi:accessory gene regulator B
MKELIVNSILNNISKYYNYDQTKINEIKYGLESIYLTITKTIIVFIISIIMKTTKELLLFMLFYGILRIVAFGLHAKKAWHCWVLSLSLFALIPFLIKILKINIYISIFIYIICIVLFAIYAPADTEKRPLIHKKKRIIYKILTLLISITFLVISRYTNNIISNALLFSCIMQALMILPISYNLLGLKYDNYKRYRKKGGT